MCAAVCVCHRCPSRVLCVTAIVKDPIPPHGACSGGSQGERGFRGGGGVGARSILITEESLSCGEVEELP